MKTTIDKAPACLNMNDKAMWVTGWNEAVASMEAQPESEPSDRAGLIAKLRADFNEDRVDFDNIKAAANMLEADAQCTRCKVVADDNNEHIQRAYRAEAMLAQQVAVPQGRGKT